ncbi:MAG: TraR/DksA C4-type zinc finger protein [Deltaproteobacteria bacterium]|nr:TraR/DksA C4-type zinc finger protein [Deltaproteobacteria bacterium]
MLEEIKTSHAGDKKIAAFFGTIGEIKEIEAFEQSAGVQSHFLRTLIGKKEDAEKALARLIEREKEKRNQFSADELLDELDHAEQEILANTNAKLIERKIEEIKKIEDLIRRAQNDEEFGLCEECGERIAEDRLIIVPEATRCVPCQRELEQFESRPGGGKSRFSPSKWDKKLDWEDGGDDNNDGGFIVKPAMEYTSFADMEEIELAENPGL